MQRAVLILCVAAVALAAPAPQYRGNGASKRVSPERYQNVQPGEGTQQYSRQATPQRSQPTPTTRAPSVDRGSLQYRKDSTRQRTKPASVTRAPAADRSTQQYSQRSQPAPTQQYSQRSQPTPTQQYSQRSQPEPTQQYSQRSQPAPTEQYSQRTQPAPVARAPLGSRGTQQYSGGASSKSTPPVPIVRYQNSPTGDGGNQHAYETGNGIEREEGVFIKELTVTDEDGKQKTVKIPVYRGSFKYQQPDGSFVEVQYEADETGFHAVGDSIPQALQ